MKFEPVGLYLLNFNTFSFDLAAKGRRTHPSKFSLEVISIGYEIEIQEVCLFTRPSVFKFKSSVFKLSG